MSLFVTPHEKCSRMYKGVKSFETSFYLAVLLKWLLDKWDSLEADLNITLVVMREALWPFNLWDIFQWQHTWYHFDD